MHACKYVSVNICASGTLSQASPGSSDIRLITEAPCATSQLILHSLRKLLLLLVRTTIQVRIVGIRELFIADGVLHDAADGIARRPHDTHFLLKQAHIVRVAPFVCVARVSAAFSRSSAFWDSFLASVGC